MHSRGGNLTFKWTHIFQLGTGGRVEDWVLEVSAGGEAGASTQSRRGGMAQVFVYWLKGKASIKNPSSF